MVTLVTTCDLCKTVHHVRDQHTNGVRIFCHKIINPDSQCSEA